MQSKKKKKKPHKRKKSMQRNNSLINAAEDRMTKRTKMPMSRVTVDCGRKESGKIITKKSKREREGVKEVKTETTGHDARAEKERMEEGKTEWSGLGFKKLDLQWSLHLTHSIKF